MKEKIGEWTMDQIRNDGHSTHLPILDAILDQCPSVKSVIEFGVGRYSTQFLLSRGCDVTSYESDKAWMDRVAGQFSQHPAKLNYIHGLYGAFDALHQLKDSKADLMFNDGAHTTRWLVTQMAIVCRVTPIIVSHDTEDRVYGYDRILLPPQWQWVEVMDFLPWTSVATNNADLVRCLQESFSRVRTYVEEGLSRKEYAP